MGHFMQLNPKFGTYLQYSLFITYFWKWLFYHVALGSDVIIYDLVYTHQIINNHIFPKCYK